MTCEYPRLMAEDPDLTIPDVPLTVVARVYAKGDPLGGNICPPVSLSHPRQAFINKPPWYYIATGLLF